MRIAIMVSHFPPKWLAGTEIATYNIAKHLAEKGHEVHVLTSPDKGLPKEDKEQGFYVHRIGQQKIRFIGVILFWLNTLSTLKRIDPDVVHCQDLSAGILGFLANRVLGKPYCIWGQGSDVYIYLVSSERGLSTIILRLLNKLALMNADAVIALTEDMKGALRKFYSRDILILPNGIDPQRFENLSRDELRHLLQLNIDWHIILWVGRFRPEKGVQYLIKAMEIIRKEDQYARLVLVGEGPEEENLKHLVKQLKLEDYVNFTGQVPNEEVPHYMAASDIFVLPSLSESFGIVNLEAMASGLPIVATNVGGIPEIVKNGENGFLVEPKNPRQIADKLLFLLADGNLRQKISANNKQKAKDYSWESIVESLEQIYIEITSKHQTRH